MIVLHVALEPGFRKADINSIPTIRSETIFQFASQRGKIAKKDAASKPQQENDLRIDFVQVKKAGDVSEVKAVVFPAVIKGISDNQVRVSVKIQTKNEEILEMICEKCPHNDSCSHLLAFIFWLHRKSIDTDIPPIRDFWGSEVESLAEEEGTIATRIRDIFACNDLRLEADMESAEVDEAEGCAFLESVLNEMEHTGLHDSAIYKHCRSINNEFEALFIHHTLLDASNNLIKDTRTFSQHMEDQAKNGLFERLTEMSRDCYKSPLWLETQYMRLRCSLIYRISLPRNAVDDNQILEALFCKNRERHVEERQQLKQHKRFILKQTEKLENKTYHECGLLLSESYPYIVAAPDGITDDHIVEIKVPKTEEEFEKYLEGRETIAPKYMAQIQIQMYMANVTKALYCVLSPTFDVNGALHYVWVQADMEFVASLLTAVEDFWKDVVFPRLVKIYLSDQ